MDTEPGRARRYDVESAILYRQVGTTPWHAGRTVNVSRADVLFRSAEPAPPGGTRVDMILSLPPIGSQPGARVHCSGTIVKSGDADADGQVSTTATIDRYHFLPAGATSEEWR